jgi:hypothetical protein
VRWGLRVRGAAAGFGLSDLLIVLAAIVSAAALGATELEAARRRSAHAQLRSELRRLAVAQESFFYDRHVYAADLRELAASGFVPSPGVRVIVHEATLGGWSATAWRPERGVSCSLFVKSAAPVGGARTPGEIRCD